MATSQWEVTGFEVITSADRAGSDHRPVFAELTPAS
jgi:endonuclease/exonuclease/phosphatase family metal-dependent hydrolase